MLAGNLLTGFSAHHIVIDDKALLKALVLAPKVELSEYCLANIYLYRDAHHYQFIKGNHPFVTGVTYDGMPHVMPLFDIASTPPDLKEAIRVAGACFYPIGEQSLACLDPAAWKVAWHDDDSDYIYDVDNLSAFKGSRLRNKRRLMERFQLDEAPTETALTPENEGDAIHILGQWLRDVDKTWSQTDYSACLEALRERSRLGLFGNLYYAKGNIPAGFILAGKLSDTMAVVHFAKGLRQYDGIFPYMFNRLALACKNRFSQLNFEQDMGKGGFRQAKRSYGPVEIRKKYRLFPL